MDSPYHAGFSRDIRLLLLSRFMYAAGACLHLIECKRRLSKCHPVFSNIEQIQRSTIIDQYCRFISAESVPRSTSQCIVRKCSSGMVVLLQKRILTGWTTGWFCTIMDSADD